MLALPPGWATDLAVLELSGATIEDRRDHLVVTSPGNPGFHWGNCLVVTDAADVEDAGRWIALFQAAFPYATWISIGLIRAPSDERPWTQHGVGVDIDPVLTTRTVPRLPPPPVGYTVRPLQPRDWEAVLQRAMAENAAAGAEEPTAYERFARARTAARQALSERNEAAFFGAFAGEALVADLGVVRCGVVARYQSVSTHPEHRRRGLASHLLGVAGRWASDHGCDKWVIVTEEGNPALRVYRNAGFEPDIAHALAYRKPPR